MKKALFRSLLIIFVLLMSVYLAGVYFFGIYFLPNTFVNGSDVSLTKISELEKTYNNLWKTYELNIVGKNDRKDKITAKDIKYEDKLIEKQVVNQNPFYWFLSMLIEKDIKLKNNVTYDLAALSAKIDNIHHIKDTDIKDSENAKIIFKDNVYAIEEEVYGDRVNKYILQNSVINAFKKGETKLDLEKENLYNNPTIKKDDEKLNKKLGVMNKINAFIITYDFSDRLEELKGEKLLYLYREEPDGNLVPDPERAENYVHELATKFDTYRGTRDFNMTGGGTARIVGGIYGWKTDVAKTRDDLVQAMAKMESVKIKPHYSIEAVSRNVNDIGTSYIEIDIARQHMWLYKEGNLIVDSPVVTGNVSQGNGTPTGVGRVWSRERNRYLTGADYRSYVNYWLPFNWSGCGIHDSSWRSQYGGNIYKTSGSHGCVNTPPGKAKIFFDNTFHGMPVVVYNSYTQKI